MDYENIKSLIDVNDVIGKPIDIDKYTKVLPISKVSYGFVGGNSGFNISKNNDSFVNAKGYGITVTPLGIVIFGEKIRYIKTDENVEEDKWMNLVKSAIDVFQK